MTEPRITEETVETPRLRTFVRSAGPEDAPLLVLVHGNVSSSVFWDDMIRAFADRYRVIAPDFRSYGRSEQKDIDATRGVRDFSDDLHALLETIAPDKKAQAETKKRAQADVPENGSTPPPSAEATADAADAEA